MGDTSSMQVLIQNRLSQIMGAFLMAMLVFACNLVSAQNIKVTASAKNTVSVGEQFGYVFTFNTNSGQFTPPSFDGFTHVGGPAQSSSMSQINGKVSMEVSYTYYLRADKEGTFTVGPGKLSTGGNDYTSNSVTIKVVKGQIRSDDEDLFIKTYVSKSKVYEGEQLVVTHKLFSKHGLVAFESVELPSYTGFWAEELDKNKQYSVGNEVHNGTRYQVATLGRSLLYPQKSGKITIEPAIVEAVIRKKTQSRSYSIFDQIMGYEDVKKKVQSEKATVEVQSLPASGRPSDFTGLTGNFNFSVDLTKSEVEANEAVNLKITVSGSGNLKLVNALNLEFPPDIEAYDPKVSDNIKVTDNGMSGSRTFDYVLIPRHAGDFELGPFPFNYFDSDKGRYVELSKPSINLKVGKGTGANADQTQSSITINNKEDLKVVGKDIRYIKTGKADFKEKGKFFYKSGTFYSLVVGQLLLFIGFVVYHNQQLKRMGNMALVKSRKATKEARKRLALANKLLKENKTNEYYEEVFKALWGYVSDKLGIPVADLNKDNLRAKLVTHGVEQEVIEQYISLIDKTEFARFAPSGGTQEMGNVYQEAIDTITKVEGSV